MAADAVADPPACARSQAQAPVMDCEGRRGWPDCCRRVSELPFACMVKGQGPRIFVRREGEQAGRRRAPLGRHMRKKAARGRWVHLRSDSKIYYILYVIYTYISEAVSNIGVERYCTLRRTHSFVQPSINVGLNRPSMAAPHEVLSPHVLCPRK